MRCAVLTAMLMQEGVEAVERRGKKGDGDDGEDGAAEPKTRAMMQITGSRAQVLMSAARFMIRLKTKVMRNVDDRVMAGAQFSLLSKRSTSD